MFKLSITHVACVCSILVAVHAYYRNPSKFPPCEPKYKYPLVCDKPWPYPTYVPIQLQTEKCYPVSLPPLVLTIYDDDILVANNVHNKLFFTIKDPSCKGATLTGGPMYNKTYQFCNCNFGWDNTGCNTHGWRLQDGKGTQLEMQVELFRQDCDGRESAVEFTDGLIDINMPVSVHYGKIANPKFYNWQKCVGGVEYTNSTFEIRAGEILPFIFDHMTCGCPYYVYPGARPDKQGNAVFCANIISWSVDCPAWISADQFQVFLDLKSPANQTMPKTYSLFPMGERPCVQTASKVVVHRKCKYD